MNPRIRNLIFLIAALAIAGLVTSFQLWGVSSVPFHPDESTQLYMSSDFWSLFQAPGELAWTPGSNDLRMRYRLLDAPLSRYLFGFALAISGREPLKTDWDWSKTWEENRHAGALPGIEMLRIARLVATTVIPFSMLLVYMTAQALDGKTAGILAGLLLGLNALVLLHARRAMAESALLFGISLSLWGFIQGHKFPWLAGLGAALAFNAKQSALAIAPAGLLAVMWLSPGSSQPGRKRLQNALLYSGVFLGITIFLNPFLWKYPVSALSTSWNLRQELLTRQVNESLSPDLQLSQSSLVNRSLLLAAQLFILPPQFSEVGNYSLQTGKQEADYSENLAIRLGRGVFGGGLLLILSLSGIFFGVLKSRIAGSEYRRTFFIISISMLLQVFGLLVWVPLPWQRYVIALLPYFSIWPAFAVHSLLALPRRPA